MHDLTLAGQFADRLLLMSNGRAVASGSAKEVLTEHTISEHYGASVRVLHDPAAAWSSSPPGVTTCARRAPLAHLGARGASRR
jgi:ABC-type hemin transport system ATPase subunit